MNAAEMKLVEYLAWGAAGGLVGAMTKARRLHLPRLVVEKTRTGERVTLFDVGFLAAPLLGAFLAAAVDGRPWTAAAYGLASGYAGPALLNAVVDPLLRRLGYDPDAGFRAGLPVEER